MTTPTTAPIPKTDRSFARSTSPSSVHLRARRGCLPRVATPFLLTLALLSGCTRPAPEQPKTQTEEPTRKVELRPLQSYVPALGMRWLVQLRPKALLSHPRFSKDWEPVFAAERIIAFTQASGADPKRIEEAFIAGYDFGELYLFDGRKVGLTATQAFEARALTTSTLETKFDNLTHLTGMIEQTPHALIHIEDHLVAIAVGDIRLARIVRAYAEGKLKNTPPALEDRFLSSYRSFHPDALVRGFLRGPYEDTTDAVAVGFVTGVAAVDFEGPELRVSARALGAWPRGADLDAKLSTYVDELLQTRELRALGWGFPLQKPAVSCESTEDDLALCSSNGTWNSAAVAEALHRITAGSLAEIVNETPPGWHPEATTEPRPNDER